MIGTRHAIEDRLRRLARIGDKDLRALVDDARFEVLEGLLQETDSPVVTPVPSATCREPKPVRRHRVRLAVAVALTISSLAGAGTAWAMSTSRAVNTTSVECVVNGGDTIVPSTSGNPVTDCTTVWKQLTGALPPALVAYDNGIGGITVLPASTPVPNGFTALVPGPVQNGSLIELQESLDDFVAGLNSACLSDEAAVTLTQAKLRELGFEGWTVSPPAKPANGTTECVVQSVVDFEHHNVSLAGSFGPNPPQSIPVQLAKKLQGISAVCQSLADATKSVEQAAASLGLSQTNSTYELSAVKEDIACTRIYESVGGTIFLVLRGPNS